MALTPEQLTDIQTDLGITNDQAVFTDAELNRLFDRAGSDYNTSVYLGWRVLLGDAAKFFNYTEGNTKVERAAVFEHIKAMLEFWKGEATTAANQVAVVGLTPIPPNWKEYPATEYPCAPRRERRLYR